MGVWRLGCKALGAILWAFPAEVPPKPHGGEGGTVPSRAAAVGMGATSSPGSVPATGPRWKSEVCWSQLLTGNVGLSPAGERLQDTQPSEVLLASAVRRLLLTLLKQLAGCSASWEQEDDDRRVGWREHPSSLSPSLCTRAGAPWPNVAGNSGLSSLSQSPPRWSLPSFHPQPVVTFLLWVVLCFWCEHLLPAAGWCYMLLPLRKTLWFQNISLHRRICTISSRWSLGGSRYGTTSGGYPKMEVSPALEEVEPPPCVSPLGLCQCRGLHLLQAFPSCGVPSSMVFQCHLQVGCRTPVWAQLPLPCLLRGKHFLQAVSQFWR